MGRAGDAASFLDLVARVRDLMPEVSLRTTLIAGFPGETDDDVDELLAFLDEAALDYVGVFPYSPEEGTAAADLPGRIDPDTVRARAQRIRDAADLAAFPSLTRHVGSTLDVLVEGTDEEGVVGRWEGQAPEIDGVVHLSGDAEPGEIVRATVEEAVAYDLLARIER
jgi:ribosomal protein S12 methylthiotransferase